MGKVLLVKELPQGSAQSLLARYQLQLETLGNTDSITGSFWGAPEAGIVGQTVYIRPDTPAHSLLHETCHIICMDGTRRQVLHTDAGGETPEENAVCYLQILLADKLPGFGKQRALADMDSWGYTFRLGSAQRWFEEDANDARQWLIEHQLITADQQPIYRLQSN